MGIVETLFFPQYEILIITAMVPLVNNELYLKLFDAKEGHIGWGPRKLPEGEMQGVVV